MSRELLLDARRIVVKVGTRVLTENDNTICEAVISRIVTQTGALFKDGWQIILVSSGSIAVGLSRMGMSRRPTEINLLQAAAALGQSRLMHAYERLFETVGCETAQILLTLEDIRSRQRYINIRNTVTSLWEHNAIPVVNENDTVAFTEITFGDNDILAAHLANMIDADLLVLLTDIDGLYDRDPRHNADANLIESINAIDEEVIQTASGKGSSFSSGGMESKLKAAQVATRSGVGVVIANGRTIDLPALLAGREIGTYFPPGGRKIRGRRKWIAFNPRVDGRIVVDGGGIKAIIENRKSLLPAGVIGVEGTFKMGGNVSLVDEEGHEVARGLTNFSSKDLERIKGLKSDRIGQVLGTATFFQEVVHRDNMVVTGT